MDDIERMAAEVVRTGREFADNWLNSGIRTKGTLRSLWPATIKRLQQRMPFAAEDADVITLMGEEIAQQLRASRAACAGTHSDAEELLTAQIVSLSRIGRVAFSLTFFWEAQNKLNDYSSGVSKLKMGGPQSALRDGYL